MNVARKDAYGQIRQILLKEYFLNAYLIALLKKVGEESARLRSKSASAGAKVGKLGGVSAPFGPGHALRVGSRSCP